MLKCMELVSCIYLISFSFIVVAIGTIAFLFEYFCLLVYLMEESVRGCILSHVYIFSK